MFDLFIFQPPKAEEERIALEKVKLDETEFQAYADKVIADAESKKRNVIPLKVPLIVCLNLS